MKFGKVQDLSGIDFSLPPTHINPKLSLQPPVKNPSIYVGCSRWAKEALPNFYPRGTKHLLHYYSGQFNAIEFNAGYHRIFKKEQFEKWHNEVNTDFRFFVKLYQGISHWRRLENCEIYIEETEHSIAGLNENFEMCFLQMGKQFGPTDQNKLRIENFLKQWPSYIPLAFEVRHEDWVSIPENVKWLSDCFTLNQIIWIITDTPGRRDLVHMNLTSDRCFVRFVGGDDPTYDNKRANFWAGQIQEWISLGIWNINFFIHQHENSNPVQLANHFIKKLNQEGNYNLTLPKVLTP